MSRLNRLNASYNLNRDIVDRIKQAKTVGIAFQQIYGAPMFLGFEGMEVETGREKITGFLAGCR